MGMQRRTKPATVHDYRWAERIKKTRDDPPCLSRQSGPFTRQESARCNGEFPSARTEACVPENDSIAVEWITVLEQQPSGSSP